MPRSYAAEEKEKQQKEAYKVRGVYGLSLLSVRVCMCVCVCVCVCVCASV